MKPRYQIKIVTDFAAAHSLRGYPGDCRRLHGHNWKLEIEVSGSELDELGMLVDFKEVKRATNQVADTLDHSYLNEVEPFDKINPTAENIAAHLYRHIGEQINSERVQIAAVTVWETERACIRYSEES